MTTPDHDEPKPRRRWPTYLAVGLVLVLVVYPLSIGPAAVLLVRTNATHPRLGAAIHNAYIPFTVIVERMGARDAVILYMDCWFKITGTDRQAPRP